MRLKRNAISKFSNFQVPFQSSNDSNNLVKCDGRSNAANYSEKGEKRDAPNCEKFATIADDDEVPYDIFSQWLSWSTHRKEFKIDKELQHDRVILQIITRTCKCTSESKRLNRVEIHSDI